MTDLDHTCQHGHYDCSNRDGGDCFNERSGVQAKVLLLRRTADLVCSCGGEERGHTETCQISEVERDCWKDAQDAVYDEMTEGN